jgi:hypothetical protein
MKDERLTVSIAFENIVYPVMLGSDVRRARNVYFQYSLFGSDTDDRRALAADRHSMDDVNE